METVSRYFDRHGRLYVIINNILVDLFKIREERTSSIAGHEVKVILFIVTLVSIL